MKLRLLKALRTPLVRGRRAWRRRHERHGVIVAYHRVAETRFDPWQLCVAPKHFAQHLEAFAEFADIVPLREFGERLTAGRGTRPILAITFDDGYADNLHAALPALQRASAPATVFLSTGWTGRTSGFWWDRLTRLVFEPTALPGKLCLEGFDYRWRTGSNSQHERQVLHLALWQRLRDLDDDLRDDMLERLARWAGLPATVAADARPMTADEVGTLAASPLIEIGAHSVRHRPLSSLPEAQQMEEMAQSRRDCERLTGVRPESFAYPFGDHTADVPDLMAQAGFTRACSLHPDLVWQDSDPFRLPRIGALDRDGVSFSRRLRREWLP